MVVAACGAEKAPPFFVGPDGGSDADCNQFPELCGGCYDDIHCYDPTPYCDVRSRACVVCQPPSSGCGQHQICQEVRFGEWRCGPECRSNPDCARLGGGTLCCDGQCVNPANDPKNCGACGSACAAPANGSPACVAGHCVSLGCGQGLEECDHNPATYCETSIASDPSHCGKCGNVCKAFANGLPTCINSVCAAVCAPGYADCNDSPPDGCETDTTFDVLHCGGCGKVCGAVPHGSPSCDLGKCSFRCDLDYADCDGMPANGCETDVRADPLHCGHCGNVCGPKQSCLASRCQ